MRDSTSDLRIKRWSAVSKYPFLLVMLTWTKLHLDIESSRKEDHLNLSTGWNNQHESEDGLIKTSSVGFESEMGFFSSSLNLDLVRFFGKSLTNLGVASFDQSFGVMAKPETSK